MAGADACADASPSKLQEKQQQQQQQQMQGVVALSAAAALPDEFELLLSCPDGLTADELLVDFAPEHDRVPHPDNSLEEGIEETWRRRKERQPTLYNGTKFRYAGYEEVDDDSSRVDKTNSNQSHPTEESKVKEVKETSRHRKVILKLGLTDYKTFVGTNLRDDWEQLLALSPPLPTSSPQTLQPTLSPPPQPSALPSPSLSPAQTPPSSLTGQRDAGLGAEDDVRAAVGVGAAVDVRAAVGVGVEDCMRCRHLSSPLGNAALVLTADGCALLLQRGEAVGEFPNHPVFPGGHSEPAEVGVLGHHPKVLYTEDERRQLNRLIALEMFAGVAREVEEETGAPAATLKDVRFVGICRRKKNARPVAMFVCDCELTAAEVATRYHTAEHKFESTKLRSVPLGQLLEEAKAMPGCHMGGCILALQYLSNEQGKRLERDSVV